MQSQFPKASASIKPDQRLIRVAAAMGGSVEFVALLRPIIFMILIDRLITSASLDTIAALILILAVLAVMDAWLNYKKSIRLSEASAMTFADAVFEFWRNYQDTARRDGRGSGPSETADLISRLYGSSTSH